MCIVVCVREWVREFMCIEGAIHTPIRVRRHTSKAYAQKVCVCEAGKEGERERVLLTAEILRPGLFHETALALKKNF